MSDESPRDAARRLLARARRRPSGQVRRQGGTTEPARWSGPGPDDRDPAPVGATLSDLVRERDWRRPLDAAGLLPRWEQIVGAEIAGHCRPERLVEGELRCVAESTAWATQLRLLAGQVMARINADVGPGVVTRVSFHGPVAPDWRHGRLRVSGRGPRDTYG